MTKETKKLNGFVSYALGKRGHILMLPGASVYVSIRTNEHEIHLYPDTLEMFCRKLEQ